MGKLEGFKKIESIKKLQKYRLPIPETIFIFNFHTQENEIEKFLIGKRIVTVRSDKKGKTDFCPHNLRCERKNVKSFVKKLVSQDFAVILQRFVPIHRDRVSGNILTLKNQIVMELMGTGPLTQLTRDGRIDERILFNKNDLKEIGHSGKRLIQKRELRKILNIIKSVPPYKILEFTLRPEGLYFWQILDDQTSRKLGNKKSP